MSKLQTPWSQGFHALSGAHSGRVALGGRLSGLNPTISIYLRIACSARLRYTSSEATPSPSLIRRMGVIRRLLPDDFEQSARDHGAMQRRRGHVSSAEHLLRLILMHVTGADGHAGSGGCVSSRKVTESSVKPAKTRLRATLLRTRNQPLYQSRCKIRGPLGATEMQRALEHFFTNKPQGTRMGLALSRSITEAHDGRL
jgi:hypothetical protein